VVQIQANTCTNRKRHGNRTTLAQDGVMQVQSNTCINKKRDGNRTKLAEDRMMQVQANTCTNTVTRYRDDIALITRNIATKILFTVWNVITS
jgi:hypothetical protein